MPRMTATRQPDSVPNDPDTRPDNVLDSYQASLILGISEDGVRKRVIRGTLKGYKDGRRWYVYIPDSVQTYPTNKPDSVQTAVVEGPALALAAMEARIDSLEAQLASKDAQIISKDAQAETQLAAKDQQIGELHRLLAQTALNQAPARPWWKIW